jgi:hypothetical protein
MDSAIDAGARAAAEVLAALEPTVDPPPVRATPS